VVGVGTTPGTTPVTRVLMGGRDTRGEVVGTGAIMAVLAGVGAGTTGVTVRTGVLAGGFTGVRVGGATGA
jgi:hypothetical protein